MGRRLGVGRMAWLGMGCRCRCDRWHSCQHSANINPQPSTVVVEQVVSPPAAAPDIGTDVPFLPAGSQPKNIGGTTFYENKDTWYKPYIGINGAYYEVVSPPAVEN